MLHKNLRRSLRRSPLTELAVRHAKSTGSVDFPEIGLSVTAGPGDIIIDCGANVGDMTSRFARTGATVHAFEPHPRCYEIISRRFAALSNVTCHHRGVMDRACTLTLSTPVEHDIFDSLAVTVAATFVEMEHAVEQQSTEVACVDFAAFIRSLGKRVRLVKMDIEGAEVGVLNHLLDNDLMGSIDYAVVETHERLSEELKQSTRALRERIAAAGLEQKIRLDWI